MNDNNHIQFSYSPFNLWLDSVMMIFIVLVTVTTLCLVDKQPLGFIFGITIGILSFRTIQKTIRNLYRSLNNQSAITLTDQYVINHMNNTKIHWKNISEIVLASANSHTILKLTLFNRKIYEEQVKEPLDKLHYFLEPKGKTVRIKLNYIKGTNHELYTIVNDIFVKKKNYY